MRTKTMNEDQQIDAVIQHGGWFVAALTGAYLWILKLATGRTISQLDRIELKLDNFAERLAKLEGKVDK